MKNENKTYISQQEPSCHFCLSRGCPTRQVSEASPSQHFSRTPRKSWELGWECGEGCSSTLRGSEGAEECRSLGYSCLSLPERDRTLSHRISFWVLGKARKLGAGWAAQDNWEWQHLPRNSRQRTPCALTSSTASARPGLRWGNWMSCPGQWKPQKHGGENILGMNRNLEGTETTSRRGWSPGRK